MGNFREDINNFKLLREIRNILQLTNKLFLQFCGSTQQFLIVYVDRFHLFFSKVKVRARTRHTVAVNTGLHCRNILSCSTRCPSFSLQSAEQLIPGKVNYKQQR
jgi:hypothetical protein